MDISSSPVVNIQYEITRLEKRSAIVKFLLFRIHAARSFYWHTYVLLLISLVSVNVKGKLGRSHVSCIVVRLVGRRVWQFEERQKP